MERSNKKQQMKMQIQEKDKEEKKDDVIVKQKDSDKIEAPYPKSP